MYKRSCGEENIAKESSISTGVCVQEYITALQITENREKKSLKQQQCELHKNNVNFMKVWLLNNQNNKKFQNILMRYLFVDTVFNISNTVFCICSIQQAWDRKTNKDYPVHNNAVLKSQGYILWPTASIINIENYSPDVFSSVQQISNNFYL